MSGNEPDALDDESLDFRCFIPTPPPPPNTIDVTDVVHVATLVTIQLRDAVMLQGRGDVVAALDVEDVRATFLDEVVQITQNVMVELGEGSDLRREIVAIKGNDIRRAAVSVIYAFDNAGYADTLDTTARG